MIAADNGHVVLDAEGNDKDPRADPDYIFLGFSYAYKFSGRYVSGYVPIYHYDENVPQNTIEIFKILIRDSKYIKPICHNLKYDAVAFKTGLGVDLLARDFYDTMLMAHMVDENLFDKGLDYVSRHYGGKPKNKTDAQAKLAKAFGWHMIPVPLMYDYSTNDALITYQLFEKLLKEFKRQFPDRLWEVERDWIRFIVAVEQPGVSLDYDFIAKEIEYGEGRLDSIRNELGGNPGSPKFLQDLLLNRLGLPTVKRSSKTGKPSFDKKVMEKYEEMLQMGDNFSETQKEIAQRILEFRGWSKTLSSNYRAYLELESSDKRLRPNYKIHGTTNPRLSCEKPNLQQIPRESEKRWNGHLKKAFIPKNGYQLWGFDYSNLELRVMAVYAGQENLLEAFRQGFKPFDVMAERLGYPRQVMKTFNYMTSFGAGIDKIAAELNTNGPSAAKLKEDYFTEYPGFLTFTYDAQHKANTRGYVQLWTGRRRHFPYVYVPEKGKKIRVGTHKAMNSIVQGGAAELVKYAGIALHKKIDWRECTINLQVHDQYVAEIKTGTEDTWIPIIKETMEDVGNYCTDFATIPFPVEVKKWGED